MPPCGCKQADDRFGRERPVGNAFYEFPPWVTITRLSDALNDW
jgi:hypothetical protein